MADDLKKTGRHDDERINVEQDHEVGYWAEKFGVSREQLRQAVQAGGCLPGCSHGVAPGFFVRDLRLRALGAVTLCGVGRTGVSPPG